MPDDSGPDSDQATLLGHVHGTTPPVSPVGSPTQDTLVPLEPIDPRGLTLPDAGYTIGDMIGRGGMGEIMSATDRRIGREVAIKRMRGASSEPHAIVRFLREARIQARLDHPSIVPVHELGTDENGRPFFTMKRLVATTLLDKLAKPGPMQPLLRAFIDVCMAVELAHQRGVVHRDLKPANIMLGDFGEVYVIDWGVARVLSERPAAAQNDIDTLDEGSETAGMLGTPGYMAPEQIDGSDVSTATDVYALGAILFEILTAEPLHPRGRGALATTLDTPQDSPAKRKPERGIPPELDMACFEALAREPKERPTARQIGERVQAYLDGDRDTAQRRKLAAEQLAQAHAALASDDVDGRATAMRKAGRALALDPESIPAGELVTKLMLEPPTVLPPALRDRLDDDERVSAKARSRTAMIVYLSVFLFVLPVPWMTVASWPWFIALNLTVAGLAATSWLYARRGQVMLSIALVGNLALVIAFSRLASPLMLTPTLIGGVIAALAANPRMLKRRGLLFGWGALACTLPLLLEAIGVLPQSWSLVGGVVTVRSTIFSSPGIIDGVMLVAANTGFVLIIGIYAISTRRIAHEAKRRIQIQKWHLEQMLPRV